MGSRLFEHLEKIRQFVVAAERGSFSAAASELRVTQPTISHSIKILEEVLGAELLLRTSRGVEPTPAGAVLLCEGKRLLELSHHIERTIRETVTGGLKSIEIGTKEPYAVHLMPRYMKAIEEALPGAKISFVVRRTNEELLQLLRGGTVQTVIIPDPPLAEDIVAYELARDGYALFAAKESLAKIDSQPIYLFRSGLCGQGKRIEDFLEGVKVSTQIRDVDNVQAARAMCLAGHGLGLLPKLLVQQDVVNGLIASIQRPDFPTQSMGTVSICLCFEAKNAKKEAFIKLKKALIRRRLVAGEHEFGGVGEGLEPRMHPNAP